MDIIAKAERVVIQHGSEQLEVFRIEDKYQAEYGEYRLSQSQVLERINEKPNWFSELASKKKNILNSLLERGFRGSRLSVSIQNEAKARKAQTVSIEDAGHIWGHFALQGNQKALSMLIASNTESIERRADKAFGIFRTEQERNERFQAREEGKKVRLDMTDAVQWYIEKHKDKLSENAKQWMYKHCSDALNLGLFGRTAKKLCIDLNVKDRSKLRDALTADELRWISQVEELGARLVVYQGLKPLDAVKESLARNIIPVVDRKAE
jgi:hypothetical protein